MLKSITSVFASAALIIVSVPSLAVAQESDALKVDYVVHSVSGDKPNIPWTAVQRVPNGNFNAFVTVSNTSGASLPNVAVSSSNGWTVACPSASLAAGASMECVVSGSVPQGVPVLDTVTATAGDQTEDQHALILHANAPTVVKDYADGEYVITIRPPAPITEAQFPVVVSDQLVAAGVVPDRASAYVAASSDSSMTKYLGVVDPKLPDMVCTLFGEGEPLSGTVFDNAVNQTPYFYGNDRVECRQAYTPIAEEVASCHMANTATFNYVQGQYFFPMPTHPGANADALSAVSGSYTGDAGCKPSVSIAATVSEDTVPVGSSVVFSMLVTNTGDANLAHVSVEGAVCERDSLKVGESMECSAEVPVDSDISPEWKVVGVGGSVFVSATDSVPVVAEVAPTPTVTTIPETLEPTPVPTVTTIPDTPSPVATVTFAPETVRPSPTETAAPASVTRSNGPSDIRPVADTGTDGDHDSATTRGLVIALLVMLGLILTALFKTATVVDRG